jgi:CBS domain-containing protein
MSESKTSGLPVTDEELNLIGILFLSDFRQIVVREISSNSDMNILEVLDLLNPEEKGCLRVGFINQLDTFKDVVQKLMNSPERKCYELEENRVKRVVTETDIFRYFVVDRLNGSLPNTVR